MLSHEIWNKKQNPSSSNESSSRQMFGLPRLELKSFLCSPVHPSQYLRGAIKSSEDSFSFLILHGSNSLILCGSYLKASDDIPDIQCSTFPMIL